MLVSVEGNKSLPLIWSPAVLVGSISGLLSRWPFKPGHCVSYLGLISSVLPVKDPWPPGLCWPCIDLSLGLLFQPSCPENYHFLTCFASIFFFFAFMPVTARQGWRHWVHFFFFFFDLSRSKCLAPRAKMPAVSKNRSKWQISDGDNYRKKKWLQKVQM